MAKFNSGIPSSVILPLVGYFFLGTYAENFRDDKNLKRTNFKFQCEAEGLFADTIDCKIFYRCLDWGEPSDNSLQTRFTSFKFQCGNGLVFDSQHNSCVHSSISTRSECQHDTSEPLLFNFSRAESSVLGDDDTNDHRYYEAEKQQESHFSPYPLSYHKLNVDSSLGPMSDIDNAIGEQPLRITRSPSCSSDGFFPVENDCTRFYRCVANGKGFNKYEFSCGEGTVWDPDNNVCNHAWAVQREDCKNNGSGESDQSGAPNSNESEGNLNPNESEGNLNPNESNPSSGEVPNSNGSPYPETDSNVNSSSGYPNPATTEYPQPNPPDYGNHPPNSEGNNHTSNSSVCPSEGFHPVQNDCKKFIRCVNNGHSYTKFEFECAEGTVWDKDVETCNYPEAVERSDCKLDQGAQAGSNANESDDNSGTTSNLPATTNDSQTSSTNNEQNSSGTTSHTASSNQQSSSTTGQTSSQSSSTSQQTSSTSSQQTSSSSSSQQTSSTASQSSSSSSQGSTTNSMQQNTSSTASGQQTSSTASGQQTSSTASGQQTSGQSSSASSGQQTSSTASGQQTSSTASGQQTSSTASGQQSSSSSSGQQTSSTSSGQQGSSSSSQQTSSTGSGSNNQTTTTNQQSTNSTSGADHCTSEGFFPSSKSCNKFYRCVSNGNNGYTKYDFDCGPGTVFDPDYNVCNHPWAVHDEKCRSEGDGSGSSQNSTTPLPNEQTTKPVEPSTDATSTKPSSTSSKPEGSKPTSSKPTSTSKPNTSTLTGSSKPPLTTSPAGSNNTSTTKRPTTSTTTNKPGTISSTTPSNTTSTTTNKPGTISSTTPSNTTNTTSRPGSNETTSVSSSNNTTEAPCQNATKPAGKVTCTKAGFYPYPGDCKKFYRCVDWDGDKGERFSVYYFDCPEGTIWDPSLSTCNHEESVYPPRDCSNTGNSTAESTSSTETTVTGDNANPVTGESTTPTFTESTTSPAEATTPLPTEGTTNSAGETIPPSTSTIVTEPGTTFPSSTGTSIINTSESTTSASNTVTSTVPSPTDITTTIPSTPANEKCPETKPDQFTIVCPTGFRRHPKYCNIFYQCTTSPNHEIKVLTLSCTNGTVYDDKKIQCLPPDQAQACDGSMLDTRNLRQLTDDSIAPIPVKSDKTICPSEGSFSYKDDCRLFYKCKKDDEGQLNGFIYQCPEGFGYWNISKRCEKIQKIPCGSKKSVRNPSLAPIESRNLGHKK